uniref:Uncharacterized protein n=1 Tax=Lactuca sativa TaxID=4236 RepID=A0A9R1WL49_LACSA|nr:hypothetical protein LSAT_V11C100033840 [Lactuca sativa]
MYEGKKIVISDKDPTTMSEIDLRGGNHQSRKIPSKRKTPEKRQLHDLDSDFESSCPSKKAKKGVTNQESEKKPMAKEFYSMKNRCSPDSLLSIILGMVIYVEGKELKVTTQSVLDMLGIPKGGNMFTQLDQ